jgi:hypothetical protein
MPLRNFGLSFSRARANAGVTWRPSSKLRRVAVGSFWDLQQASEYSYRQASAKT